MQKIALPQDAIRVFFHELGHFIANEMNKKYFNGSGVKEIWIIPFAGSQDKFEGETKVNISADGRELKMPTKERVPEVLASSVYGCIFQSYFQNEDKLNHCFNENGKADFKQWKGCLDCHAKYIEHSNFVNVENDYYTSLRKDEALKELMRLDPYKYMTDTGGNVYRANVELLKTDTISFIDSHYEMYNQLIADYKKLLN